MSLLAADIGNSHTVLGLVDDGEVSHDWRVATAAHRTADEWSVLIRGLLGDLADEGRVLSGLSIETDPAGGWPGTPA